MLNKVNFKGYDTLLQPTEWRYSAAIVGLNGYLEYCKNKYGVNFAYLSDFDEKPNTDEYVEYFDGILYNREDITEEHYLEYAEEFFKNDMTHIKILEIIEKDDIKEDDLKHIGELIKSKTVLNKELLKGVSVKQENFSKIRETILNNRYEIIKKIFINAKKLYKCYSNPNLFLADDSAHCRLQGYTVDENRKSRSLGFCFSKDSFKANDIVEFDFIPFAFSNSDMYETYFINNNYNVKELVLTNKTLSEKLGNLNDSAFTKDKSRERLLLILKEADSFIEYDVEIITKGQDDDYYETLFVRSANLKQLKNISANSLKFSYNYAGENWINLEKEVYDRCLNDLLLDDLIIFMLKLYDKDDKNKPLNKTTVKFRTNALVEINAAWKLSKNIVGGEIMTDIELAKKTGFVVAQKLEQLGKKNKVASYRQKLIGTLVAHDYDRLKEVLLSLSSYVDMEFSFFYKLLENTEDNLDIAFAFVSALTLREIKE